MSLESELAKLLSKYSVPSTTNEGKSSVTPYSGQANFSTFSDQPNFVPSNIDLSGSSSRTGQSWPGYDRPQVTPTSSSLHGARNIWGQDCTPPVVNSGVEPQQFSRQNTIGDAGASFNFNKDRLSKIGDGIGNLVDLYKADLPVNSRADEMKHHRRLLLPPQHSSMSNPLAYLPTRQDWRAGNTEDANSYSGFQANYLPDSQLASSSLKTVGTTADSGELMRNEIRNQIESLMAEGDIEQILTNMVPINDTSKASCTSEEQQLQRRLASWVSQAGPTLPKSFEGSRPKPPQRLSTSPNQDFIDCLANVVPIIAGGSTRTNSIPSQEVAPADPGPNSSESFNSVSMSQLFLRFAGKWVATFKQQISVNLLKSFKQLYPSFVYCCDNVGTQYLTLVICDGTPYKGKGYSANHAVEEVIKSVMTATSNTSGSDGNVGALKKSDTLQSPLLKRLSNSLFDNLEAFMPEIKRLKADQASRDQTRVVDMDMSSDSDCEIVCEQQRHSDRASDRQDKRTRVSEESRDSISRRSSSPGLHRGGRRRSPSTSGQPHQLSSSSSNVITEQRLVRDRKRDCVEDEPLPGLIIRNLPSRCPDATLRASLYQRYRKLGDLVLVKICGDQDQKYGVVQYTKSTDVREIVKNSGKTFLGSAIKVELTNPDVGANANVDGKDKRPSVKKYDELDLNSSRTVFISDPDRRYLDKELLRNIFSPFGTILSIVIMDLENSKPFVFIQFADIVSAVKAINEMYGEYLGNDIVKLSFGKTVVTRIVWLDKLSDSVTEAHLRRRMNFFGHVTDCIIDPSVHQALVYLENKEKARKVMMDLKGRNTICGKRVQVDFASKELEEMFLDRLNERLEQNDRQIQKEEMKQPLNQYSSSKNARRSHGSHDTPTGRVNPAEKVLDHDVSEDALNQMSSLVSVLDDRNIDALDIMSTSRVINDTLRRENEDSEVEKLALWTPESNVDKATLLAPFQDICSRRSLILIGVFRWFLQKLMDSKISQPNMLNIYTLKRFREEYRDFDYSVIRCNKFNCIVCYLDFCGYRVKGVVFKTIKKEDLAVFDAIRGFFSLLITDKVARLLTNKFKSNIQWARGSALISKQDWSMYHFTTMEFMMFNFNVEDWKSCDSKQKYSKELASNKLLNKARKKGLADFKLARAKALDEAYNSK